MTGWKMDMMDMTKNAARFRQAGAILVCILFMSVCASAADTDAVEKKGEKSLLTKSVEGGGGDELLLFEDIPVVVSASRISQAFSETTSAVSILTAEDIHYSGVSTLAEMLQFAPGMQMVRFDRNRFSPGIRGMNSTFSDRTAFLINGNMAMNPIYGGPDVLAWPLLLEDIERIEVVRGPAGATWGANALNGVVNVITKKTASFRKQHLVSIRMNSFRETKAHLRWADKHGKLSWRLSAGHYFQKSTDDALDNDYDMELRILRVGPFIDMDDYRPRDFCRKFMFNGETTYEMSDENTLTAGLAYVNVERGDHSVITHFPRENELQNDFRAFTRFVHDFDSDTSLHLKWFGNYYAHNRPSLWEADTLENSLEGEYRFTPVDAHRLVVGANVRWVNMRFDELPFIQGFTGDWGNEDEYFAGIFAVDMWEINQRFTLETQLRLDYYSEVEDQYDWSGRMTLLTALDESRKHVIRTGAAKSFRAPLYFYRNVEAAWFPMQIAPGVTINGFEFIKPDELNNEETWSLEAGYRGVPVSWAEISMDAYFQRYIRMIGAKRIQDSLGMGRDIFTADNIDGADSVGGEARIEFKNTKGRLGLWYSYVYFDTDREEQSIRANFPAEHNVGVTGRLFLPALWTLNANYRFTDIMDFDPTFRDSKKISKDSRLDLTVSKSFGKDKEFMFGVLDAINRTHGPNYSLESVVVGNEFPGRTIFGRLQIKF